MAPRPNKNSVNWESKKILPLLRIHPKDLVHLAIRCRNLAGLHLSLGPDRDPPIGTCQPPQHQKAQRSCQFLSTIKPSPPSQQSLGNYSQNTSLGYQTPPATSEQRATISLSDSSRPPPTSSV